MMQGRMTQSIYAALVARRSLLRNIKGRAPSQRTS